MEYLVRTVRYISVTIDMGFFCRIESSDAVCRRGPVEYPDIFDLSNQKRKNIGVIAMTCDIKVRSITSFPNVMADQSGQFQKH